MCLCPYRPFFGVKVLISCRHEDFGNKSVIYDIIASMVACRNEGDDPSTSLVTNQVKGLALGARDSGTWISAYLEIEPG